jgi:hypothetical protein
MFVTSPELLLDDELAALDDELEVLDVVVLEVEDLLLLPQAAATIARATPTAATPSRRGRCAFRVIVPPIFCLNTVLPIQSFSSISIS